MASQRCGSDVACMMGCRFIASKRSEECFPVVAHCGVHKITLRSIEIPSRVTSLMVRIHNTKFFPLSIFAFLATSCLGHPSYFVSTPPNWPLFNTLKCCSRESDARRARGRFIPPLATLSWFAEKWNGITLYVPNIPFA
jgi:hypothetical protein